MSWYNYNGKLLKKTEASVVAENRGLRYGDGLFETIKLVDGNILFAGEHFARLWKGMQVLQFDIPKHFTPEKLTESIFQLAQKNQHLKAARVRLTIIRGNGGLYDAENNQPIYIIETSALANTGNTLNTNGLVLGFYNNVKKSCDILSNLKHNNFLLYVMAAFAAQQQQWNDAVVLNTAGNVCETTIANIFLVKDKKVFTPALSEGCIAGILRDQVILHMKQIDLPVEQTIITREKLLDADEVFLTNSIYNLRWVQSINEKKFSHSFIKEIYTGILPTIS